MNLLVVFLARLELGNYVPAGCIFLARFVCLIIAVVVCLIKEEEKGGWSFFRLEKLSECLGCSVFFSYLKEMPMHVAGLFLAIKKLFLVAGCVLGYSPWEIPREYKIEDCGLFWLAVSRPFF